MSQYTTKVLTTTGSQDIYGIWSYTLTSTSDYFLPGDDLTCAGTGAVGKVVSYSQGTKELRFYITSTEQPATGEVITSTGTLSGTLAVQNEAPSFVGNVDEADLFFISGEASYEVGSISTRGHVVLSSNYAASSKSDVAGYFSDSFTINYGAAYPEPGDQAPTELIKRGLIALDAAIANASGTVANALQEDFNGTSGAFSESLTISGVPVATGTGTIDHGELTGLSDDDHTQYMLADGTRPFSGTASGIDLNLSETLSAQSGVFSASLTISGAPPVIGDVIRPDGSVPFTGDQSMGDNRLTDVGAPSADSDATTFDHGFNGNWVSFSISDDGVVRIDNANPGMVLVVFTPATGSDNTRFGVLGTQVNQATTTLAGGTDWVHLSASDTPPGGTSGTDTKLNFQQAASTGTFWINNRLGGTRSLRLGFFMASAAGSTVTATTIV